MMSASLNNDDVLNCQNGSEKTTDRLRIIAASKTRALSGIQGSLDDRQLSRAVEIRNMRRTIGTTFQMMAITGSFGRLEISPLCLEILRRGRAF
jgi:hypothetical protein